MSGFETPTDLTHNRGLIADPEAFAREQGAASWLFLCGEEFASMDGGMSYADVERAVPVSANVVSDPPTPLDLELARKQIEALDRPAEADARDLPDRTTLVRADLPLRRPAGGCVCGGRARARRGRRSSVRPIRRAAGVGGRRARAAVLTEPPVKVTAEAARRYLVARHFLAPARSIEGGPDAVLEVIRRLGSIQFDPIAVAGRNHDLMLHARVAGYEPAWCDALYERRKIFETTNKALSFIPASEFPWYRVNAGRKGPRFHTAALADNAAVAERVLERIRADGPLCSADFERESGRTKDWFGLPENAVRSVLEAYTVAGVIGLARREGNTSGTTT